MSSETFLVGSGIDAIKQNLNLKIYPNPITKNSVISYELKKESNISIEVYNGLGQKLKTFEYNTDQAPGAHSYSLSDIKEYTTPMLFLRLVVDGMSVMEVLTSH